MIRSLAAFASGCGGRLQGEDRAFTAISTDTRSLRAGELFIALRGPNFDGNAFVPIASAAGAAGAVVSTYVPDAQLPQIVVADTQAALSRAARHVRGLSAIPFVGVAGSNGKTTVKEMIRSILAQHGKCLATRGNLNNHIGVPLTLLRLEADDRFAVIEIGANQPGDVAALVELTRPTVGLITNAGAEHLEGFGSLAGVARAEGEMVEGLDRNATAVINADDPFADLWRGLTAAQVLTFGLRREAQFSARSVGTRIEDGGFLTRFELLTPHGEIAVRLHLAGEHNVVNALAAAAAASAAGATLTHIQTGLAAMEPVKGRLQLKTAQSGAQILDDSYNANPSSVRAGIDVLAALDGRHWLVFGDMAELGSFAAEAHEDIGRYARERGIERLFAYGPAATRAVEAFGKGGEWFTDVAALVRALSEAGPEVRMLIKGSRVNRLERVVEALERSDKLREAG